MQQVKSPTAHVASNVSRARDRAGLSVSELARRAEVSKATVLGIEEGRANPTLDTLSALADALEVSLPELISEHVSTVVVHRAEDDTWVDADGGRLRALQTLYGPDLVHVLLIELDSEGHTSTPHEYGSRESVYVISGEVVVGPTTDPVTLSPGDWVHYTADTEHVIRAVGDTAQVMMLMQRSKWAINRLPIERQT